MQTITPELEAILKSKLQAGASGFHGMVVLNEVEYFPLTMQVDHSLQTMASAFSATFANEDGSLGLAADVFPANALFTAWAWYGDYNNRICVFTGFIDKIVEHRDARTVTLTARDWAKVLLVQDILVTDPQGADEDGAVRDQSNFVYLDYDISDIVNNILDKAGYPAAQRQIQPTNFVVDEWRGRDGSTYADAIGELADIVAFNAFADELGYFHFQASGLVDTPSDTDNPPEPVYTFETGVDVIALDPQRDDYDTKTRVRAVGPYTTLQDAWTEVWHYNTITKPTGVRYDPATPTYVYVADGSTRKVYKLLQADGTIAASTAALVPTFLNGLSGDPSDSTVYWTLETPWGAGSGSFSGCKVRKHLKSDDSVVATFTLASGMWTDMKVGADGIWCSNFTTDKIHKLSKTDGSQIAEYTITYNAVAQVNPVGIAIDGTTLYLAFYGKSTMLVSTTSTPSTITRVLQFSGTQSLGGDIDTDTHTELYATAAELSLVYKYTLFEPVTTDVSVEVTNTDLEAELGIELATGAQIRRLVLHLDVVTSYAQATEAAARWLDKLDQYRNVLDVGIIGNPAIQKGDMVRVTDPVSVIDADFMVDTYRSSLAADGTYLGILSLVPWTSSYGGPGTSDLLNVGVPAPDVVVGSTASGTSHVIPYPDNLAANQMVIVVLGAWDDAVVSWPAAITPTAQENNEVRHSGIAFTIAWLGYRRATGAEGASFTVTTNIATPLLYHVVRVAGAHLTAVPEGQLTGSALTNPTTEGNDPSAWGTEDTTWLTFIAIQHGGGTPSVGWPTDGGYPEGTTVNKAGNKNQIYQMLTSLRSTAAAAPIGIWSGGTLNLIRGTIAVRMA